ncbi:MAG: peptidase M13 [Acidobacteriota bacterium]|nr:peptidase M13 [Acidobacteriota bacterium]
MNELSLPQRVTLEDLSPEIRPQDDLFRHVNGKWIEATEIPSDTPRYGAFMMLRDLSEARVRDLLEDATNAPAGSDERKCGDLYQSFLDEEAAQRRGATPLRRYLTAIDELHNTEELIATLARLQRDGAASLFDFYVSGDPGEPTRNVVILEQGGLSLPNESYYREDHAAGLREAFVAHVATMFTLAGIDEPDARAQRVLDFETALAAAHWDTVKSRNRELTYNLMPWAEADEWFTRAQSGPTLSLTLWRDAFAAPQGSFDEVVVRQPSFLEGAGALLASGELARSQDWMRYHVIASFAPYLSREFTLANFEFYGRTLTGTPEQRARWKRGVALVEGVLGDAIGKLYVERHFSSSAKAKMDELVGWLVAAYRESISSLEWMSDETRARALDKLELFDAKIGYPKTWRDFSDLEISPDDLIGNVSRANAFELARQLRKVHELVDRDEWLTTPQTVNAFYNPVKNDITFPAAILQPPFFGEDRDAAENFGAIGAVIGHEIGHGFDDQGSKSDGTGRQVQWWTADDRAAFEARAQRLIEQYNALSPRQAPGRFVNGAFTVGENIGDLGGAGIAWKAYQLSLGGAEAPVIDGLTGAQRFFYAWALAWRGKGRDEDVAFLLSVDPHSPSEFRCNQIVRNLDAFYDAFDVTPADAMWLEPGERVTIW